MNTTQNNVKGVKTIKLQLPSVINSRDGKRQAATPKDTGMPYNESGNESSKQVQRKLIPGRTKDMPTSTMNVDSVHSVSSVMGERRDNPGTLQKQRSEEEAEDIESLQKNASIDAKEDTALEASGQLTKKSGCWVSLWLDG